MRRLCFYIEKRIRRIPREIMWKYYVLDGSWRVPCKEYMKMVISELDQLIHDGKIHDFSVESGGPNGNIKFSNIAIIFEKDCEPIKIEMSIERMQNVPN